MEHRVLLLLLLVALANAGPLTSRHRGGGCATSCPQSALPPAYSVGRAYTFDYSTDMRAQIRGASEESAGLRLDARIVFDFLAPCEVAMRLSDIRVRELDPSGTSWVDSPQQARFAQELTASDAHFALADGVVGDVCADITEPEWVLNIKKAAIGLLQNSNTEQRDGFEALETDISGRCKVTYNVQQETSKGASVTKVTDLMSCPDQQKVRSSFQSSSYQTSARIQSMPLTRANRTCRVQYDRAGHLKDAVCTEEHMFRPFSTETAGAVTTVEQKMTFVGIGGIIRIAHDHVFKRSKLEYQHHDYKLPSESPVENVKSVLSSLCDLGTAVSPKTPVLFNELIYRLKELTTEQLVAMRRDVESFSVCRRNNQMAKQFFYDALPAVTTPAAVQMMNELISSGQISTTEADAWLTSLAFVQNPSKEMLENLLPLLQLDEPRQQAQLGITALVNQYCSGKTRCETEPVVKSIGAALQKLIGLDCSTGDRRTLLVALKAIGNAGYLTDLLPNVAQCANKESNLMEVRVAAIEALRRTPCSVDRRPLLRLMRNMDLDSELRITAYLGLMACPTIDVYETVHELLTAESSKQFASFMWTHLTNLLETSDPHKQDIRKIVEDVKLKKQYDMDKLKFSRNIEKSFFSEYLNAGAKVESNLIWSQKSFLPRSATLNMTLDLFGKSLNFLEVGGRVQGMEILLEKYLGPKGNKSNETDTNTQLAQLDDTFKLIEEKIGGNLDIKIFGHQIAFFDLWKEDMARSGGNLLKLLNSLRQMSDINWYKSISFLDTQVTIPTISGFPLRLGINGTASFILKANGKVNLKKLMKWPPEFEVEGKLVPSGAVHVSGMLGINTVFGDYGVKIVSNVYSSTEMQASVKASNGEELRLEINQPKQRQNIFNAKTSFFVVHRSVEREQNMRRDLTVSKKSCTGGGFLEKILGVEFCSEVRYPSLSASDAPQTPLVAGFELDLAMIKRDTHESYLLHLVNRKQGIDRHWKALVDMPGSRSDKKMQAEVKIDSASNKAEVILETPWKKGKAEVSLTTGADGKEVKLQAEMDGVTYARAVTRYSLVETSEQYRMKLSQLEIRLLNSRPIIVKGSYGFSKLSALKNWEMSATIENLLKRPIGVHTLMRYENGRALAVANVSSPVFSGRIESDYSIADSVSGSTTVGYKFGDETEQTVKIEPAIKFTATSVGHNLRSSVKTTFTSFPQLNNYISVSSERSNSHNHKLEATFEDSNGQISRLFGQYDIEKPASGHEHKLTTYLQHMGVKYGVKSKFLHDLAWTDVTFRLINYIGADEVSSTLNFKRQPGTIFYVASLKSGFLGDIVSKLENSPATGSISFESTATVMETDYSIKAEFVQKDSKHKISGSLKLPDFADVAAELSADTSSSEPQIAAKLSTPSATYFANATGKFDYQSADMAANINAPGVNVQAKLKLSSEDGTSKLLAELYWNPRRQQTDGIRVDGSFQTNKQAHLQERIGRMEISVPTGAVKIRLNERNEPLKSNKYIELEYGAGKKVSANFMYDINDGWTEKGIVAMLRLVTPIKRYEEIKLKLDGYGSLRVRKLQLESIINGRRFKADLLINLGNINNFHSRLSIVTPWAHASFMKFELIHLLTASEIKSTLDVVLKTEKIVIIDINGYNRGGYSGRDMGMNLKTNSAIDWFPKLLLDFAHKDDLSQFASKLKVDVNDRNNIDLNSNFDFYPSRDGVESRGNISLATAFPGYETLAFVWKHKHNKQIIKTTSTITYQPGKTMRVKFDAYDETTAGGNRQMGGDLLVGATFMDDLKLKTFIKNSDRFEANAQLKVPFLGDYQADALFSTGRMHVKVDTPHSSMPRFGLIHTQRQDGDMEHSTNSELYWGNELIKLTSKKLTMQGSTETTELVLQTPFETVRHERLVLQATQKSDEQKFSAELSHLGENVFGMTFRRQYRSGKLEHGIVIESVSDWMKSVKLSTGYLWDLKEKEVKASIVYNEVYTSSIEFLKARQDTGAMLTFAINAQSPATSKGLSVTVKKTPESVNSLIGVTLGRDRKVTVNGTARMDGIFELEAQTPFEVVSRLKINLSIGTENGERWISMIAKHECFSEFQMVELKGRLKDWKKASLEFKLSPPRNWQSDMRLAFNHLIEDTEGQSTFDLQYPGGRILSSTEFTTAAGEITGTWKILTPFSALEELELHARNRVVNRFVQNEHGFKVKIFGTKIQGVNNVQLKGWQSVKFSSQLDSNLVGLESFKISAHQTIDASSSTYDAALKIESPNVPDFSVGLNWKMNSPGFEGSLYTKSEFEQLKEMNLTVQMSFTDWMYWTAKSKLDFLSNVGGRRVIKKEIAFRGRVMSASFSLENPTNSLSANLKADGLQRDAILIEGALNAWGDEKTMKLKLEKPTAGHLKAALEVSGMPTVSAEAKFSIDSSIWHEFSVLYGERQVMKNSLLLKSEVDGNSLVMSVNTTVMDYKQETGLKLKVDSNSLSIDATHRCSWMSGPVVFKFEAEKRSTGLAYLSANANLQWPDFDLATMKFLLNLEHAMKGIAEFDLRIPTMDRICYGISWNFLNNMAGTVSIELPYIGAIESKLSAEGDELLIMLEVPRILSEKWELRISGTASSPTRAQLNFRLLTSLPRFREISINHMHNLEDENQLTSELMLPGWTKKARVHFSFTANKITVQADGPGFRPVSGELFIKQDSRDFEMKLLVRWNAIFGNQDLEVRTKLTHSSLPASASVEAKLPLKLFGYPDSIRFKLDGDYKMDPATAFNLEFQLAMSDSQPMAQVLKATYGKVTGKRIFTVTMPGLMSTTISHEGKRTEATIVIRDLKLELSQQSTWNSVQDFEVLADAKLSGASTSQAEFHLRHRGHWRQFSNQLTLKFDMASAFDYEGKFKIDGGALSAEFGVETPVTDRISVRFGHQGWMQDFSQYLEVKSKYHAPVIYKGQFSGIAGKFEASVPRIGEAKVRLSNEQNKMIVTLYVNKNRLVEFEKELISSSGKVNIRFAFKEFTVGVKLEGRGNTWWNFERKFSASIQDHVVELTCKHILNEMAQLYARYIPSSSKDVPAHLIDINYRRSLDEKHFEAGFTLIENYKTRFGVETKLNNMDTVYLAALTVRTSLRGLHYTSISSSFTLNARNSGTAELKLTNDYTKENKIVFDYQFGEKTNTIKATFDGAYLGKHWIKFSQSKIEKLDWAINEVIEVRSADQEPITLILDRAYSTGRSIELKATLKTPFEGLRTSALTFVGVLPMPEGSLQVRLEQEYVGTHELRAKIGIPPGQVSASLELDSDIETIDGTKFQFDFVQQTLRMSFTNPVVGTLLFNGRAEMRAGAATVGLTVQAPWRIVGTSAFSFEWKNTDQSASLELRLKSPFVGENSIKISKIGSEVGSTQVQSFFGLSVYLEKLNEHLSLQSKFTNRLENSLIAAGSQKIKSSRFGEYSLSEEVQVLENKVFATVTVKTPYESWDKTSFTYDFETKDDARKMTVKLDTKLYGVQDLTFRINSNELKAHVTLLSIRNELTITGWNPQRDSNGAIFVDFFASISSPFMKASTRVGFKQGHFSAMFSSEAQSRTATAATSATWEIKPQRVLLDLAANVKVNEIYSQAWGALCDLDLANQTAKRLIVKLTAPLKSIETTELAVTFKMHPLIDASVLIQSPLFGNVKVKGMWHAAKGPLVAPIIAKFRVDGSIDFVPKFEVSFDHVQKHEHVLCEFGVKSLSSGEFLFKADSLLDAFNKKIQVNLGVNNELSFKWQSKSDLQDGHLDEQVVAVWKQRDQYFAKAVYSWKNDKTIIFKVKTPFSGYEKLGVKLVAQVSMPFDVTVKLMLPNQEIKGQAVLDLTNGLHARVALKLPGLPELELAFQSAGSLKKHDFELTAQYATQRFSVLTSWDVLQDKRFRVKLETPVRDLRLAEFKGEVSNSKDAKKMVQLYVAFNDYTNELKLNRESNEKGMKLRLHCPGKLVEMKISRSGHDMNKAVRVMIEMNRQTLVDVTTRLQSMFATNRWGGIRLPHSGFVKVTTLFGSVFEQSSLEWGYRRIWFSGSGLHDLSVLLKLQHKESYFNYEMSMLHEGKFQVRTSVNVPKYGIRLDEVSAAAHIVGYNSQEKRVIIDLSQGQRKIKFTGITNLYDSLQVHLTGISGIASFVSKDSLALQAHFIRSKSICELSIRLSGLQAGELKSMLSVKKENGLYQLTASAEAFARTVDGHLLAKSRRGWLSSVTAQEYEGRITVFCPNRGSYASMWTAKIKPGVFEADVNVVSGIASENKIFSSKLAVSYGDEIQTKAELIGFGLDGQVSATIKARMFDLTLKSTTTEFARITWSCEKSGYKTVASNQRLTVRYMVQVYLTLETKQEVVSWNSQFTASAKLEVDGTVYLKKMTIERKGMLIDAQFEWDQLKPIAVQLNLNSFLWPRIFISYGRHEAVAEINIVPSDGTFRAEFSTANPWLPIKVKLNHIHRPYYHRIQHEHEFGKRKYTLDSSAIVEGSVMNAKLYYKSPSKSLKLTSHASYVGHKGSLSNTVEYNGVNYLQLDGNTQITASPSKGYKTMCATSVQLSAGELAPLRISVQHHFNADGWKDSAWSNEVSLGEWKITHSGKFDWNNLEVASRWSGLGHLNVLKFDRRAFFLDHATDTSNVVSLSAKCDGKRSELKFSSGWISFHTNAQFTHDLRWREGKITIEQIGSHQTPRISASWDLNTPTLQGDLNVGTAKLQLRHEHRSNKDFTLHYAYTDGPLNHQFKGKFSAKPSTRSEYRMEVEGTAELSSTWMEIPFSASFQHHHNNWLEHSCAGKIHAGDWKLLHKSVIGAPNQPIEVENYIHQGSESVFESQLSSQAGVLIAESKVGGTVLYKVQLHYARKMSSLNFFSARWGIDSVTKIKHDFESWKTSEFSIAHEGLLSTFKASTNWNVAGKSKRFYLSVFESKPICEIDMSSNDQDGVIHFNHKASFRAIKLQASGIYDGSSVIRVTEATLIAEEPAGLRNSFTWAHRFGSTGFVKFLHSDKQNGLVTRRQTSWNFNSAGKTTFEMDQPEFRLNFKQNSPTSGELRSEISLPSGRQSLVGSMEAAPSWKSGRIRFNNTGILGMVYAGNWNFEGATNSLSLDLSNLKIDMRHTQHSAGSFEFAHKMTCAACPLSSWAPEVLAFNGYVNASSSLLVGKMRTSLTVNSDGPLPIAASWNFNREESLVEISTRNLRARFAHGHASLTNFNFDHTIMLLGRTHTASGGLRIEPSTNFRQRLVAHLNAANQLVNVNHEFDGWHRHKWNHQVRLADWNLVSSGHRYISESLMAEVVVSNENAAIQQRKYNISWKPNQFEYQAEVEGTKIHEVKLICSEAEKVALVRLHRPRWSGPFLAKATMKKTCPKCFQIAANASLEDTKLVALNAELLLPDRNPMEANFNVETPFGKIELRNRIFGKKLSSFKYVGTVSTGLDRMRFELESQILSIRNVTLNVALNNYNLLPFFNTPASFSIMHRIDSSSKFEQSIQLRFGNGIPFAYRFTSELMPENQQLLSLLAANWNRKSMLSVNWLSGSFVDVQINGPLSVSISSSCPVVPALAFKLQPGSKANTWAAEFRVGDRAIGCSITIDPRVVELRVQTPFDVLRQIGGKIALRNELPMKLTAQAGFEYNDYKYDASLNADFQTVARSHRSVLTARIVTPHRAVNSAQFSVESSRSPDLWSAEVVAGINENEAKIIGNITSEAARLKINLPIEGYRKLGFKVLRDQLESQARLHMLVSLPYGHYVKLSTAGTYNGPEDISTRMSIESSFRSIRNAKISLNNQLRGHNLEHTFSLRLNGEKWHDIKIRANSQRGEITVNCTQPVQIVYQFTLGLHKSTSEVKVTIGDWVPFHLQGQLETGSFKVNRKSFVTLRTPYRTVQINRAISINHREIVYKFSFTPNMGVVEPLAFEASLEDKGDQTNVAVDTKLALIIPSRRIEAFVGYEQGAGLFATRARLNWDAANTYSNKVLAVAVKTEYTPRSKVAGAFELTFANQKPYKISLTTSMRDSSILHSTEVSLDVTNNSRDTILLKWKATQAAPETIQVLASLSQASSNVDFKINGEMKKTSDQRQGNLAIHFTDSQGRPTAVQSVVEYGASALRVNLILPSKRCSLELKKTVERGVTAYSVKTDGKKLELRVSNAPDLQVIYEPRENDRLWAGFGYPDNWHLRADVHRVTNEVKMQQLLASMQLKSRHLMKVKLHWNPTSSLLRYAAMRESMPAVLQDARSLIQSMKSTCVHEILAKLSSDLILPDLSVAAKIAAQEMEPLRRDLSYMSAQFREMYARNEFYSRDICQAIREVGRTVASYAVAAVQTGVDAYSTYIHPHVAYSASQIASHASRCYGHATRVYAAYRHHQDRIYRTVNGHVLRYVDGAVDSIRPALDAAHAGYRRLAAANPLRGSLETLSELRTRVARSVSQVNYRAFDLLHADLRDQVLTAHRSMEAGIGRMTDQAVEVISAAKAKVRHHANRIIGDGLVSSMVSGAYAQSKWFLDHFNIEQNLKDFARDNYLQGVEYVRQNTIGLATDYLGLSKNEIIENNFSQGKFEAHLYSPMTWTDLKTLPSSGLEEVQGRLASSYKSARNSFNTVRRKLTAVCDVVYDSIPDFDMPSGSWIPKFKGVASVIGDHIVTFDGRHYDFRGSGECAYLLTRDFRSRAWAVGMTYGRSGKSLDIFAYGRRITITPSLHVLVNGVQQELPLNIGDLSIVRTGWGLKAKDLGHLFTVTVDPEAAMHSVSVSGWYHGRLGGLFGNFDNEPFNDMISSSGSGGRRAERVLDFTGSWRLGACRHANLAVGNSAALSRPHEDCLSLFESPRTSPFRRCYAFVDPAPFREICAEERRSGGSQQQVCRAALAYIRHCNAKGLRGLKAPAKCLTCNARSPQLSGGEGFRQVAPGESYNVQAPSAPSADIVLVLEERGCIGQETLRRLPRLVQQLKSSLSSSGVADVRFGLLGFGNPSHHRGKAVAAERSRPHWHTLGGELMGSDEQLLRALNSVETHNTADASVDGARGSDALEAVRMATRLEDLRPEASTHVILVACDECHEGRRSLQSVRQSLKESNVRLHLLTELAMPTYFFGRRSQAFGVDASQAFSLESPEGSAELHGFTRRPIGKCAGLAAETGGSVFDLRHLRRRQYAATGRTDLFARVFADRLAAVDASVWASGPSGGVQECRCTAGSWGTRSRLTCRPV